MQIFFPVSMFLPCKDDLFQSISELYSPDNSPHNVRAIASVITPLKMNKVTNVLPFYRLSRKQG